MSETNKALDKPVTTKFLLKFALPTIIGTLIIGSFGIVDSIFVSRLLGQVELSAVNIVMPFMMFAISLGFMLGIGGNALAAKEVGKGNVTQARKVFSLIVVSAFLISAIFSSVTIFFPNVVLNILGVDDFLRDVAHAYMRPIAFGLPLIVLSSVFQQFFMTEGKASIGATAAALGGIVSAGLNWLFLSQLGFGLASTAVATVSGSSIATIVGILYFAFKKGGTLRFVKPTFDLKILTRSALNGFSEFIAMMSGAVVSTITNNIIMDVGGWEGLAAFAVIFATTGILSNLVMGYVPGILPIISFNYGKDDTERLQKTYSLSLKIIAVISIFSLVATWLLADPFIRIFVDPYTLVLDSDTGLYHYIANSVYALALDGYFIMTTSLLFFGLNNFGSMFFTSLNNAKASTFLSILRTLVFVVGALLILPSLFGMQGVFFATLTAEILAAITTLITFSVMNSKYKYKKLRYT